MITRIDHIAILAPDFVAAVGQHTKLLGQAPYAETGLAGRRSASFTLCNARILLIEAADEPARVCALGLAGDDADSCIAQLRAQGITVNALRDPPAALAAAALWELSLQHTRGLPVRIIDRPAPALPAAMSFSADGVEALDHVVIRSAAVDQALALYGGTLGMRLALDRELAGTRMLFFRSGGVTVEVIEDPNASAADTFYGVAYRVRDLEAAHLRLMAAGFTLTEIRAGRKPGTRVFSTRSPVPTLFIRDPSRD